MGEAVVRSKVTRVGSGYSSRLRDRIVDCFSDVFNLGLYPGALSRRRVCRPINRRFSLSLETRRRRPGIPVIVVPVIPPPPLSGVPPFVSPSGVSRSAPVGPAGGLPEQAPSASAAAQARAAISFVSMSSSSSVCFYPPPSGSGWARRCFCRLRATAHILRGEAFDVQRLSVRGPRPRRFQLNVLLQDVLRSGETAARAERRDKTWKDSVNFSRVRRVNG